MTVSKKRWYPIGHILDCSSVIGTQLNKSDFFGPSVRPVCRRLRLFAAPLVPTWNSLCDVEHDDSGGVWRTWELSPRVVALVPFNAMQTVWVV